MSRYWSAVVHGLTPYVPGEQPKLANLVKLNTNENPYGPSPKVLDAVRAEAADTLRLYPDPGSDRLRAGIAALIPARTGFEPASRRITAWRPTRCSSETAPTRCWRMRSWHC